MSMTETKTLNAKESLDLLREVLEEFGDEYVDPGSAEDSGTGCDYTRYVEEEDGETGEYVCGCIVGQVLHKKGASIDQLRRLWGSISLLEDDVLEYTEIKLTVGARLVLRAAQRAQDKGETWGDAVNYAEDTYRIVKSGAID